MYSSLKVFYWSDSLVALGYILNSAKKFHTFVSNRVQLIQELTSKTDWSYVSTDCNPADMASRGLNAQEASKHSAWFKGPQFLKEKCIKKYQQVKFNSIVSGEDPEVKSVVLSTKAAEIFDLARFNHCKTWMKLLTAVLCCIKFFVILFKLTCFNTNLHQSVKLSEIKSVVNLESCKYMVVSLVQKQFFSEELKALSSGEFVKEKQSVVQAQPLFGQVRSH